jgi:hypothetical protein
MRRVPTPTRSASPREVPADPLPSSRASAGSARDQTRCLPATFPYGCKGAWAKIYTATQGATFGALFIVFNIDGDPTKAHGYFKNINGQIVDRFGITVDASAAKNRARQ